MKIAGKEVTMTPAELREFNNLATTLAGVALATLGAARRGFLGFTLITAGAGLLMMGKHMSLMEALKEGLQALLSDGEKSRQDAEDSPTAMATRDTNEASAEEEKTGSAVEFKKADSPKNGAKGGKSGQERPGSQRA